MRILVTGGTGFVGSHSVGRLVRAGHEVRLLVRDPGRIRAALAPLGVGEIDFAVGDVTDAASIESVMTGCAAVLHAASVYSLDSREAGQLQRANVGGTRVVIEAAESLGLDPIVYVSSTGALLPPDGVLDERSPVKRPPGPYYRSKADAELIARRAQERGAPVVITYPSAVFGPDDPHLGENTQLVLALLKRYLPAIPKGGLSVVDVRDVAEAQAAVFEPGQGPRRYLLSGTSASLATIVEVLEEASARRIPHVTLPRWALWAPVRGAGLLQRILPVRLPLNVEGFDTVTWDPKGDDSRARAELGFSPRPLRATLADMVAWLEEIGRITRSREDR